MHKQLIIAVVVCAFGGAQASQAATETAVARSTDTAYSASSQAQGTQRQLTQEVQEHRLAQQKAESEFLSTLSGKTTVERTEAIAKFKEKQAAETKKFRAQMHEKMSDYKAKQHKEFVSSTKTKLAANKQMTDDEKTAFLARIEQQYATAKEYDDTQFEESQKALVATSKAGLSKEEKVALQKEHAAKMNAMKDAHKTKQAEEGKAFRDKMKAEARARAAQKKSVAK